MGQLKTGTLAVSASSDSLANRGPSGRRTKDSVTFFNQTHPFCPRGGGVFSLPTCHPLPISVYPRKSAVKVFVFQFSLLAISAILAIFFFVFLCG
jgi:hypothetical protein